MNTLPHFIDEYYGPQGRTEIDAVVAAPNGLVHDVPRGIVMPAGYPGISIEAIQATTIQFGRNLEITPWGDHTFENTFALDQEDTEHGIAHVATLHSALTINPGQAWEQSLRHLALASDLQLYDGSPGSGGSSFFRSRDDIAYISSHGRFMRDVEGEPEPVELIRDLAEVLTKRARGNIAYLTADDPYGIGIALALAVALHKKGHAIRALSLNKPPELFIPKQHGIDTGNFALNAIKAGKELFKGNEDMDAMTPDPHRFDRAKHGKPSKEWLEQGYRETHPDATRLPATHLSNARSFIPKQLLNARYVARQAQQRGEGLVQDVRALRTVSPDTDVSFIVPLPGDPSNDSRARIMKERMRRAIVEAAGSSAETRAYFIPDLPGKYPETYFHGFWLGVGQDALNLRRPPQLQE